MLGLGGCSKWKDAAIEFSKPAQPNYGSWGVEAWGPYSYLWPYTQTGSATLSSWTEATLMPLLTIDGWPGNMMVGW